jgi:hypothetical protein
MAIPIFKSISIGSTPKEALISQLENAGIKFNTYANKIFDLPEFDSQNLPANMKLVKVSFVDIGLSSPKNFAEIVKRAESQGLNLCPLPVGAYLRLKYLEQPKGPYLTVASKKPKEDPNFPNGLYLRNFENSLWLRGYRASDDYLWPVESEFIFVR